MSLQYLVDRSYITFYGEESYLKENYVDIMHAFAGVTDDEFFYKELMIVSYTVDFLSQVVLKYDNIAEKIKRDPILKKQVLRGSKLFEECNFYDIDVEETASCIETLRNVICA